MKWNGFGCHTRAVSTSQITWNCPKSINIRNSYDENSFWPQTRQIFSLGISHRITWNFKWNEIVSGAVGWYIRGGSPHHRAFALARKALKLETTIRRIVFCPKSEKMFTWNSKWNETHPNTHHPRGRWSPKMLGIDSPDCVGVPRYQVFCPTPKTKGDPRYSRTFFFSRKKNTFHLGTDFDL